MRPSLMLAPILALTGCASLSQLTGSGNFENPAVRKGGGALVMVQTSACGGDLASSAGGATVAEATRTLPEVVAAIDSYGAQKLGPLAPLPPGSDFCEAVADEAGRADFNLGANYDGSDWKHPAAPAWLSAVAAQRPQAAAFVVPIAYTFYACLDEDLEDVGAGAAGRDVRTGRVRCQEDEGLVASFVFDRQGTLVGKHFYKVKGTGSTPNSFSISSAGLAQIIIDPVVAAH